jgi:hypothetical protein
MKRLAAVTAAALVASCSEPSDPDLSGYVRTEDAAATYLAKADAASTYLTQESAAAGYLGQDAAATTYLAIDAAAATYLATGDAAATYLSRVDAADYLLRADADATFLTQGGAAGTYLSQTDAALTYLTPGVAAAAYLRQDAAAAAYLTKADAAAAYLTPAAAAGTFLSQASAAATYLGKVEAGATYLTQDSAAAAYLGQGAAAATYLAIDDATATYLAQADAARAYLTPAAAASAYLGLDAAESTYLTKADAAAAYLTHASAAGTYLSQSDASATYLTKAQAETTYQRPLQVACGIGQALRGFAQDGTPVCGMADCATGRADCDGDPSNGCEADLLAPATCGSCGNACAGGQKCWPGGVCTTSLVSGKQVEQIDAWAGCRGTWNLCYRATRDGRSPATFHAQCNNRGSSFFVAQLSTGKVVGGFVGVPWQSAGAYRSDGSAFLFSLSPVFRHGQGTQWAQSGVYAVYDNASMGPAFGGGHDFYTDLTSGWANLGYSYACRVGERGQPSCHADFTGGYNFGIVELEVYTQQ